ncbi:MAG: hypothetical protein GWO41_07080, partial [candidate division Zixibacteria bacterium]|nr:hypothetical protein [candidate division Zixibacteria bacterium]NIW39381.1 hypothetical protein [candidate division Zixibacteria bacterium]NIX59128.1 hypothetical protein [candidate division Zixibacteria bacterium]
MEKRGREISLYVDPSAYETSLHGILSCIDCHEGFNPDEFPHRDPMQPVDCSTCHDDVTTAFHNGAHTNQLNCMSCHTDAHKMEIDKTITQPCQDCHSDAQNEIETSIHFTAAEGPECYDCHSAHQTRTITTENCLSCHGEKEFVHKNGGDEKKLKFVLKYTESIHGELIECSDCHTGHKILPADSANSTVNEHNIINTCGNCHGDIAADYLDSEHG